MRKVIYLIISVLCVIKGSLAQNKDDILCPTPPMGFISWNYFEGNINEEIVKEIADAFVVNGLKDVGYEYIIIDDIWHGGRDENGKLFPDPEKFPNGIKVVADYVHSKGLKFGIYTDIAAYTCAGMPGSLGYERIDAKTFAEWGVDYIKCDYCHAPKDLESAKVLYRNFIKEVRATGRPIVFAVCEWGQRAPHLWAKEVGAQLWRTTWDLRDTWEHGKYDGGHNGIMEALDRQVGLENYSGPGHWNDPDMLVVGLNGKGSSASVNGANGCSVEEYKSQFALWSMLSAPLLITCDVRNMDDVTKSILTNEEIIEINQDLLGKQAKRIYKSGGKEIWAKPLQNGDWCFALLNRDSRKQKIILNLKNYFPKGNYIMRDLWKKKNVNDSKNNEFNVKPHECKIIRVKQFEN